MAWGSVEARTCCASTTDQAHWDHCPNAGVKRDGDPCAGMSLDGRVVVNVLVPQWVDLFREKNRKYAKVDQSLGARGVFPDINRKVGVLRQRVWEGEETPGEPTKEVIFDLIGHLFLMAAIMEGDDDH